jgi:hypothetical protein
VIVQGGLHHLKSFPDDLEKTLSETCRVLRDDGLCVVVEPWWLTPFLGFVRGVCGNKIARRLISKIDSLASMMDHERETYDQWLSQPQMIMGIFERFFATDLCSIKWGKYTYIGHKRSSR